MVAVKKVRGIFERTPGVWWISYRDYAGVRHIEKSGRRSHALALLEQRRTERRQRKKLPENLRQRSILFGELIDDALEHTQAESGERTYNELLLKYKTIRPSFGTRPVDAIKKQDVSRWLSNMMVDRDWQPATVNRWQAAFSLAFRVGIQNEKIERNPASRIRRKVENTVVRFLTADEEAQVRAVMQRRCPQHIPAFDLSIHTGMRAGEQFSLKWSRVDLKRRVLTLPKTKNSQMRHLPLNDVALAALKVLDTRRGDSQYVFSNRYGKRMENQRDWFDPVIEEVALEAYTWHVNRHTFASRLVMAGANLTAVKELMGHATFAMTLRYAHLAPEFKADTVQLLCQDQSATTSATAALSVRRQMSHAGA